MNHNIPYNKELHAIIRDAAVYKIFSPEYYELCADLMKIAKKFNVNAWHHISCETTSHKGGYFYASMQCLEGPSITSRKIVRDEVLHMVVNSLHLTTRKCESPAWSMLQDTLFTNLVIMEVAWKMFRGSGIFQDKTQLKELKASIRNVGLTKFEPGELAVLTYMYHASHSPKETMIYREVSSPPRRCKCISELWERAIEAIAHHKERTFPRKDYIFIEEAKHHREDLPAIYSVVDAYSKLLE